MKIVKLSLCDFRNVSACEISFGEGVNLLCGNNAEGKTNILEAVWLLSGQKSFRGAKENELIRTGCVNGRIEAEFESAGRRQQCSLSITGGRKTAYRNGLKEASAAALGEYFHEVVFSPEHLGLVKNGPEERRAFLDGAIGATKPSFFALVRQYDGVVYQRNALLKKMAAGSAQSLAETLDAWTQRLCLLGAKVYAARSRYTARLGQTAPLLYEELSGGEKLEIVYRPCVEFDEGKYAAALYEGLCRAQREDIRNGYTSLGPHREDFEIFINAGRARGFASQGQCKSAALVLKLAEGEILAGAVGEKPLILLDDVMSELDKNRQNYILKQLGQNQIIITCCEPGMLRRKLCAEVFSVKAGCVTQRKARKCTPTPEAEKS